MTAPVSPVRLNVHGLIGLARASAATAAAASAVSTIAPAILAANPVVFSAAPITVRNAGKFLVQGYITLFAQSGTAAPGDVFLIRLRRTVGLATTLLAAQQEIFVGVSGETVTVAQGSLGMIDVSGLTLGTQIVYSIIATNLSGSGTVAVLPGQGQIIAQELAA